MEYFFKKFIIVHRILMPVATSKAAKERLHYPHISEYRIRRHVSLKTLSGYKKPHINSYEDHPAQRYRQIY
jgi:hypothetical protein